MKIEPCSVQYLGDCSRIFVGVYFGPEYGEEWSEQDVHEYLSRFFRIEPKGCFVALDKKRIIGAIFSYTYPWQTETITYVQELFVYKTYRRKGIAKSLLHGLNEEKKSEVWLVANKKASASGFYERRWFKKDSPYGFNYCVIGS